MVSAEEARVPGVARALGPETVKHGSVRGSGRNSRTYSATGNTATVKPD
jgi:hypothetical protein